MKAVVFAGTRIGAAYGYAGIGPYRGAQAELLRDGGLPDGDPVDQIRGLCRSHGLPDRRGADGAGGYRHRRGGFPGPGSRRGIPGSPGAREPGAGDRDQARPATIVTHHGGLDDAPALYQAFDRRADGVIKAVLHPGVLRH